MPKNTKAAAPALTLFTTKKDIVAAISEIKTTGKKLDQMIQVAAISTISHHAKHGDVSLINSLIDAMPKGSRVNALRDYIVTFGQVVYDDASKTMIHAKDKTADVVGAQAISWTEFKPEAAYVPFDLNGLLAKAIATAEKKLSDETTAGEVDLETLAKVRAIVDASEADSDPLVAYEPDF